MQLNSFTILGVFSSLISSIVLLSMWLVWMCGAPIRVFRHATLYLSGSAEQRPDFEVAREVAQALAKSVGVEQEESEEGHVIRWSEGRRRFKAVLLHPTFPGRLRLVNFDANKISGRSVGRPSPARNSPMPPSISDAIVLK